MMKRTKVLRLMTVQMILRKKTLTQRNQVGEGVKNRVRAAKTIAQNVIMKEKVEEVGQDVDSDISQPEIENIKQMCPTS